MSDVLVGLDMLFVNAAAVVFLACEDGTFTVHTDFVIDRGTSNL